MIQRAVLLAKGAELTPDLLPERLRGIYQSERPTAREYYPIHLGMGLNEVERDYIKTAPIIREWQQGKSGFSAENQPPHFVQ